MSTTIEPNIEATQGTTTPAKPRRKPHTAAVHAGERAAQPRFRPTSTPIYNTATYLYDTAAELDEAFEADPSFVYARHGNPTIHALETALATLEGGPKGTVAYACASGMAALHAAILASGISSGERIVVSRDLYGATGGLLKNVFMPLGIDVRFVNMTDLDATAQAVQGGDTRVLLAETLSNPLLRVADIPALAEIAHANSAQLIVDSTFTPPVLLRPLELGADLVTHSTTKYISGHGDVLGGAIIGGPRFDTTLRAVTRLIGGALGPNEAWLTLRGLKTLALRYERQCSNAWRIARWLYDHPAVEAVHFPGLPTHPDHHVAARLFEQGAQIAGDPTPHGAMVAFTIRDADRARAHRFLDRLQLCLRATSLGDVYTIVAYPPMASHRDLTAKERARIGITDGLIRLSVGIEHIDDIIADLAQALDEC
ncbi:MAG: PLP-dependent aspartate aminotransferase family protein [Chloroflexia bacterium]